jgi:hypothetical protein
MDTSQILTAIDEEIARLEQAKSLLTGSTTKPTPGRKPASAAPASAKKRTMSAAGRARIAAAQKARWAKAKKAAK